MAEVKEHLELRDPPDEFLEPFGLKTPCNSQSKASLYCYIVASVFLSDTRVNAASYYRFNTGCILQSVKKSCNGAFLPFKCTFAFLKPCFISII